MLAKLLSMTTIPSAEVVQSVGRKILCGKTGAMITSNTKPCVVYRRRGSSADSLTSLRSSDRYREIVSRACAASVVLNIISKRSLSIDIPSQIRSHPSLIDATLRLVISQPEKRKNDQSLLMTPTKVLNIARTIRDPTSAPPSLSNCISDLVNALSLHKKTFGRATPIGSILPIISMLPWVSGGIRTAIPPFSFVDMSSVASFFGSLLIFQNCKLDARNILNSTTRVSLISWVLFSFSAIQKVSSG